MGLKFMKDFRENEAFRNSFNELAEGIFGLNFERWYRAGYWTDRYQPYSFFDGERVVANVSVNKLTLVVNGEQKRAIQIGTVMTQPNYRKKGLSSKLMNMVLEEYEGKYDIMYLLANHTVLDFYPKFGFERVKETQFSMNISPSSQTPGSVRKLDGSNKEDLAFIYEFAKGRQPVSRSFGTVNASELIMFYCMYAFSKDLFFLEKEKALVICKKEGKRMHIFDIISMNGYDLHQIYQELASPEVNEIVFHFTPEETTFLKRKVNEGSEVLFVRTVGEMKWPKHFKHPLTSQA